MTIMLQTLRFMKPYKGRLLLAVLLGFLTIGANLGLMGTSGYLIASAALRPENVLLLWLPIVGVRFFGLSRGVFRYFERLISHDLTFRILKDIRVWLFVRLERRGEKLLEGEKSGDLLGSIISDVDTLQGLFLRVVLPPAVALLVGLTGVGLMSFFSVKLGIILGIMLFLAGVVIPYATYRWGRKPGQEWVEQRAKIYEETSELITGLPELTIFGGLEERLQRLERIQQASTKQQSAINRISALTSGLMLGIGRLAMVLVLLAAIPLVVQGKLTGVQLPALTLLALAAFEAVAPLPQALQQLGQTMAASSRLFRLADGGVEELPLAKDMEHSAGVTMTRIPMIERHKPLLAIEFEDVTLRYDHTKTALKQLSFSIEAGCHTAIVGESGAGKSSMIGVLLGLTPLSEGIIRINGQDTQEMAGSSIRDCFAVVPQQVQLFHATVMDNLRIAKPDATEEEVRVALRQALLEDTIAKLPNGIHTLLGEWGERLSGGERQRMGLARALLRQAPIVVFDEPATGLDVWTEEAFFRNMRTVLKDKTVLWISHKLHGLEQMDQVFVLQEGELAEQGNHDELMASNGLYRRLREFQSGEMTEVAPFVFSEAK
ncbi:thiol reductant ABC exporter subunit CydC [Paenibacillus baekrokdamisoli]|uniref:Thiol reductant ABC exporter subunit CydC n=1 Tax=Paenibacillus baekrokdamisoli TaxID=1712516 RepID=A0A3G9J0Q8_9BACL|nr:thiol reductant ABC exporter subunit CydC [Paenibacillus baekrokdamisoli]MBB3071885.1 thiol reductant ABC exporter CydC subunit [Paenibacillus baekrokdamisoli]BBH24132.1 thiol reductant ABC exporter subunit CydC [Paenibacillus baekrokdamisoli]